MIGVAKTMWCWYILVSMSRVYVDDNTASKEYGWSREQEYPESLGTQWLAGHLGDIKPSQCRVPEGAPDSWDAYPAVLVRLKRCRCWCWSWRIGGWSQALSWHSSFLLVMSAERLNGFLHFSQRKTALSSRGELGGHGHEDSLRLGAPAVIVPLPALCTWTTLCTSKARKAESELEKSWSLIFSLESWRTYIPSI